MTSLHVIFGLAPPNQKSWLPLCTGGGAFRASPPQVTACAPQARVTFALAQKDKQTFAQKQVTTNAFFR